MTTIFMDGTLGEIRLFAGDFAPKNWEFCDGKPITVAQNPALFSVIGYQYGGDGQKKFRLPDLSGRTNIHPTEDNPIGFYGGEVTHQLTIDEMPAHTHQASIIGSPSTGSSNVPAGKYLGSTDTGTLPSIYTTVADCEMSNLMVKVDSHGGGMEHENMQPYLVLNFIICVNGHYPTRT
ncbi:MAG: phage tail protein [Saprospiraceae bacterium]|nr:phage tail protein [Saprospiraceae bacterium]